MPLALDGKDLIGIAQTGTGKTFAFGLPMLHRLAHGPGRALILLPTRELAAQVEESLRPFATSLGIGMAVFVGGASMQHQRESLRRNPRILVATPGRLVDHLQQGTVTLREVSILVLDEADRMLDMGFKPQIDRILPHVPKARQTLLFSATMAREIMGLATREMHLPLRIEVAQQGTTADRVEQELIIVHRDEKIVVLKELLAAESGPILVFSRTKHGAKKLTQSVINMGHKAAEIHANRSLAQRREALEGFKRGRYRVLIATDIAARGIDVTGIALVINYDLPDDAADYVHRIGRTARAGKAGKAVSLGTPDQMSHVKSIERLIRAPLPRSKRSTGTVNTSAPTFQPRAPQNPLHGARSNSPRFPRRRGGGFRRGR
jgi:ATP-dependent RNA helicase RhlE